jgi:hypothetical protein
MNDATIEPFVIEGASSPRKKVGQNCSEFRGCIYDNGLAAKIGRSKGGGKETEK